MLKFITIYQFQMNQTRLSRASPVIQFLAFSFSSVWKNFGSFHKNRPCRRSRITWRQYVPLWFRLNHRTICVDRCLEDLQNLLTITQNIGTSISCSVGCKRHTDAKQELEVVLGSTGLARMDFSVATRWKGMRQWLSLICWNAFASLRKEKELF